MLNIKKILESAGITENLESLEEAISKEVGKEFVPKAQYNKKVQALDDINEKVNEYEAEIEVLKKNDGKEDYEKLKNEFETYKSSVEGEKVRLGKETKLIQALKGEGFNEKIIKLLTKEINLDTIELENDSIKGWEEISKPLKEEYKDFISSTIETGAGAVVPPTHGNGGNAPLSLGEALHQKYNI